MSGLGSLLGAVPPPPPPPFTRPVTIQGLKDGTNRSGTTNRKGKHYPVPAPEQGFVVSQGGFGTVNSSRPPRPPQQVRPNAHRHELPQFSHQIPSDFTPITDAQYRDLMKHSIRVDAQEQHRAPSHGQVVRQKVIKHVEVPVVHEHKVPVQRDVVNVATRKQMIKGSRMVERHGHKDVEEMQVEVHEEEMQGTRMVWKLVPETFTHVVKKPVLVPKTRQVPYTYYEPEEVEYEVEVPYEVVHRQHGHRVDKVVGAKTVAVEQEEVYELRPHLVGHGPIRIKGEKDMHEGNIMHVGQEVFPEYHSPANVYAHSRASAQRGAPTARPRALGQVRASHGLLTSGSAGRPMSSSSRASNVSNMSAHARAAQDMLTRITPGMTADPQVRAALRKINARAKDLDAK